MGNKKNLNNLGFSFIGNRNRRFKDSAMLNSLIFNYYFQKLLDIAVAVFNYEGLPADIDVGYLEYLLISRGAAVITYDKAADQFIVLQLAEIIEYNYAHKPYKYRGIAPITGYQSEELSSKNSVVVYNNLSVLVKATENQRLTMINLYQQYDGNQPFIFADKSLDLDGLSVLSTNAPFVADKLDDLKSKVWNEALTYLGVSNVSINKKERLITDEVVRSQGGVVASRYSRLQARQTAIEQFNDIYGTTASVEFREDVKEGGAESEQIYDTD